MEFRKLISFGNSSFVISLPKAWIQKNKLNKGDMIYIEEKNHELSILPPNSMTEKPSKETMIDVTGKESDSIHRELVAAYINNSDIISIHGADLKEKMPKIRDFIHRLVALEIMEQTSDKIVAKSFLNIKDVSLSDVVRKVDVIIRAMMSVESLEHKEHHLDLHEKDVDVNRLYFLACRIIRSALKDPSVMKQVGKNHLELFDYWALMLNLVKIADVNKRFAKEFHAFNLKKSEVAELLAAYSENVRNFQDAMKSFYLSNKKLADDVAHRVKTSVELHDKDMHLYSKPGVASLFEKLKIIEKNIHSIAKITINVPGQEVPL